MNVQAVRNSSLRRRALRHRLGGDGATAGEPIDMGDAPCLERTRRPGVGADPTAGTLVRHGGRRPRALDGPPGRRGDPAGSGTSSLPPLRAAAHAGERLRPPPPAAHMAGDRLRRAGNRGRGRRRGGAADVGRAAPTGRRVETHRRDRRDLPRHLLPRLDDRRGLPGLRTRRAGVASLPGARRRRAAGHAQPPIAGVHPEGLGRSRPAQPRAPRRRQRPVISEWARDGSRGAVGPRPARRRPLHAPPAGLVGDRPRFGLADPGDRSQPHLSGCALVLRCRRWSDRGCVLPAGRGVGPGAPPPT